MLYVFISPFGRRGVVLNGGIFRRQTKRIPTHRLHNVVAFHLMETTQDIAYGVIAHMAHVQAPRGVGEHGQAIVFWFVTGLAGGKGLIACPFVLGGAFDFLEGVLLLHNLRLHGM